jgi:transcription elongation factor Elf1
MTDMPVKSPAELKDAYQFNCAACNHDQMAAPSMMMTAFGVNAGAGNCLSCGIHLHLEIAQDNEHMISIVWTEWAAEQRKELQNEQSKGKI